MSTVPALPANYDYYHRRAVQKALNEKVSPSPNLVIDGNFGQKSVNALMAFQSANKLTPDGVYGSLTQGLLEPFIQQRYILMADMVAAANQLGVPLAAIAANAETESKGAGFFSNGLPTILFERRQMYLQLVQQLGQATATGLMNRYPDIINPNRNYLGGPAEYTRLNLAITVNRPIALQSASWGVFQIMGFNFTYCGYAGIEQYVADMKISEKKHLAAYISFVQKYHGGDLLKALKNLDWETFASIYNGTAQVATYADMMDKNYMLFTTANGLA